MLLFFILEKPFLFIQTLLLKALRFITPNKYLLSVIKNVLKLSIVEKFQVGVKRGNVTKIKEPHFSYSLMYKKKQKLLAALNYDDILMKAEITKRKKNNNNGKDFSHIPFSMDNTL